ncbi:SdhD [Oceaniovalibus guishaninsula JLT2003]|uniref:Succinate dehydrogenase hydrophobic membrane anchor subunit n=1 Tax=Oceaniovalibus guishaninsula JLT2003 TaxID=1231392 RepID=K2I9D7_9RHOB|nr:succinate dehydrogenase, hydrophobic membrane anchor protein [Oceaniovalibus guishaninsula]EKE45585.1 SdhD [Oceaniovalibus guishaninsula JLT2003]
MSYLTDRKRAVGLGSAKSGTEHYWGMIVSSTALVVLIPIFIFTVGPMLGEPWPVVVAYFSSPFPAIVTALTIVASWLHFKNGVQTAIEDYSDGMTRQALLIATICLSYVAIAAGLFAVVRLVL